MSRTGTSPTLTGITFGALSRIASLERRVGPAGAGSDDPIPSYVQGSTVTAASSAKWEFARGGAVSEATCLLVTAGSSTTTVVLRKNGTTFLTVSLASGETRKRVRLTTPTTFGAASDVITCAVTVAGTGAVGLTVQVA